MRRTTPPTMALTSLIDAGDNTVETLALSLRLADKTVERLCNLLKQMGFIDKDGQNLAVKDGIPRLKYTFGHQPSYEKGLAELGKHFQKMGATDGSDRVNGQAYLGGAIFHTMEDVERYIQHTRKVLDMSMQQYKVYGVLTERADDLKQLQGEQFFRLQRDRRIVALPWEGDPS